MQDYRENSGRGGNFRGHRNEYERGGYQGGDRGYGGENQGWDQGYNDSWGDSSGWNAEKPSRGPMGRLDPIREQLSYLSGPTTDLHSMEQEPRKFTGRCRLYVHGLPLNFTEEAFSQWFTPFGEVAEAFVNKEKRFGFIKLDTRQNAEAAKAALDFSTPEGCAQPIRVRFAAHTAALKVKNLSPFVTNELLEAAFSVFGPVERAVVIVDDRGRSLEEGIVEFQRKRDAQLALKKCTEECFLLTASPRPVLVEPLEHRDQSDGLPEAQLPKTSKTYVTERELGARCAEVGSFEHEFGQRWKRLHEMEKQKRELLEQDILNCRHQLDEQMEYYLYEHEAKMLRERLRKMEEQSVAMRELRMRDDEERRRREEEELRMRMTSRDDELERQRKIQEEAAAKLFGIGMAAANLVAQQQKAGGPLGPMNQGPGGPRGGPDRGEPFNGGYNRGGNDRMQGGGYGGGQGYDRNRY